MYMDDITPAYQVSEPPHCAQAPYRKWDSDTFFKRIPSRYTNDRVAVHLFLHSFIRGAAASYNRHLVAEGGKGTRLLTYHDLDATNMRMGVSGYN